MKRSREATAAVQQDKVSAPASRAAAAARRAAGNLQRTCREPAENLFEVVTQVSGQRAGRDQGQPEGFFTPPAVNNLSSHHKNGEAGRAGKNGGKRGVKASPTGLQQLLRRKPIPESEVFLVVPTSWSRHSLVSCLLPLTTPQDGAAAAPQGERREQFSGGQSLGQDGCCAFAACSSVTLQG